jgi:hypothetical protein
MAVDPYTVLIGVTKLGFVELKNGPLLIMDGMICDREAKSAKLRRSTRVSHAQWQARAPLYASQNWSGPRTFYEMS